MENNVREEAIDYIGSVNELTAEEKNFFTEKLKNGADPVGVMDEIEDALQLKLDEAFKEAGVEIDVNDPEYKAAVETMNDEIQMAEVEFENEMKGIEAESEKIHDDAVKEIDDLKIQSLQSKIAEK